MAQVSMSSFDPAQVLHSVNLAGAPVGGPVLQAQQLVAHAVPLHQQGRVGEAAALYRSALQLQPDLTDAQHLLGVALGQSGEYAEAERLVRQAIAAQPAQGAYWNSLGRLLLLQGRMPEAVQALQEALQLSPQNAESFFNLAEAQGLAGELAEAVKNYEQALRLQPGHAQARFGLAQVLRQLQGWAAALPHYQLAASMAPDAPMGQYFWALALHMGGHVQQAVELYTRITERWPDMAEAWVGIGSVQFGMNRLREAIAAYEQALTLQPENANALDGLVEARRKACDWRDDMAALEQRLHALARRGLDAGLPAPVRIFTALYTPFDALELKAIAQSNALQSKPADCAPRWNEAARRDGRLRIGYLLADARDHPNAHNMLSVFGLHDRARFEVFTYSWGLDDQSVYRKRIREESEHFVELRGASDEEMARRIRDDGVQVLVDLMGHTADNRLGVLWRKPAPVQMNYLGFPGTSGAECMDFVLVDRWVCPPGQEAEMSEAVIRLPYCYNPLAHHAEMQVPPPPAREQAGLPPQGFVFCCFNNTNKISAEVFARWMRILQRTPGSVLWLYRTHDLVDENLRRAAAALGVEPQRLVFAPHLPREWHMARLQLADLFLDTTPYGAHTTTGDALRAGVPVLTVPGQTFASRVAASMLDAARLPECIQPDWPAYEEEAVRLCAQGMAELKARLKSPEVLPLFDTPRQVRDLERAYSQAWQQFVEGEKFSGFDLEREQPGLPA
ncbi:putative UDP-N-ACETYLGLUCOSAMINE--PEPTIDE N-ACETYLGLUCOSAMINYLTRANSFERASE SUBUNIT [Thiomonas arsenitoxydans]|nr:putative UDP-N-ACETYLGLUCOSAMINE--PEPTIDE N-ACETYLGLUCOSAMINYLTRANSFERASE SUBUNIT [Thiomonas arsenitoxydans]CQR29655.1 putative UDP-N-ACETYLGLUCOSAMINE--PEPTIDE N-ACETYLGLUCOSAMINYLTRANSFERASE SUBUNIT [Thiomonas arsenitoxydans]CQR39580.1 putative UDP-N-ACETYLGLUCOSAMINE--PEPTIDE N-ACETYLGLUCOSAMINYLTRANSFERASE SUBUNIT [Thiomonas arsenitoxydans]CQR40083.1 putative UDP-N-ACETYLGLUCOSAMINE--PEPTIDE N-ACETYLGLUCOSAMINYLTRANSFERASE SUBUNIT [Thiomonas arsenitoxydans]CQR43786.1 putative UDP-N-ACETY